MTLGEAFDPKNNSIGAIRLACALAVIIGHASPFGGYGDTFLMRLTDQQVSGARVAVDIFFVISGFLLVGSWERSGPAAYFRNRCLRIYPGLWACLIVTGVMVPLAFGVAPGVEYITTNMVLLLGVHADIPGLFSDNPYTAANGALWTLPWELWCYISIAVLAPPGLLRPRWSVLIFAGLWVAYSIKIGSSNDLMDKSAVSSPLRLFTFFYAGAALYAWRNRVEMSPRLAAVAAVALMVATAIGTVTFRHSGGLFYVAAPVTLSYLVLYASVTLPFTRINVESDLSYGLYIYGTVTIQVLVALGLNAATVSYWTLVSACVAVALPISYLSWHLVERPALALRHARRTASPAPETS